MFCCRGPSFETLRKARLLRVTTQRFLNRFRPAPFGDEQRDGLGVRRVQIGLFVEAMHRRA